MIQGIVNSRYEVVFQVALLDALGNSYLFDSVLDTGFDGSLTLPPAIISHLQLPKRTRTSAELADGTVGQFETHAATVIWDGSPKSIIVVANSSDPLLGTALLIRFELRVNMVVGGAARISQLP